MTPDPYPDLLDVEPPDAASDDDGPDQRLELSPAESLLLDALTRPAPPVVTAVEDQPRSVRAAALRTAGGRSPLAPVFREPTG